MNSLFDGLKSLVNHPIIVIDNSVYRLHYRATTVILLACSILVTAKQFFGDPIKCMHKQGTRVPEDLLNTFCWIHTTYSVEASWNKTVGSEIIYPGVDNHGRNDKLVYHAYYQWVCFCLFLQSMSFYFPHFIWKAYAGRRVKGMVVEELTKPVIDRTTREEKAELLAGYLFETKGLLNNNYFYVYFFTEVLNFVNALFQMWIINRFLGGLFADYGIEVLSFSEWDSRLRYDPMIRVFPRMTKCSFFVYGDSGDVSIFDALCVLPINILNEKIYIFFWFWLYLISLVSFCQILYRILTVFWVRVRVYSLYYKVTIQTYDRILKLALKGKLTIGDLFILKLLSKNMDRINFSAVVNYLDIYLNLPPGWNNSNDNDQSNLLTVNLSPDQSNVDDTEPISPPPPNGIAVTSPSFHTPCPIHRKAPADR